MTLYLEECLYKCKKYACKTKKSILFGSIFENSKINLDILVFLFYEWCVKTPMQCAAYKWELPDSIVSRWYKKFRQLATLLYLAESTEEIDDPGHILEIEKLFPQSFLEEYSLVQE